MDFERITEEEANAMIVAERNKSVKTGRTILLISLTLLGILTIFVLFWFKSKLTKTVIEFLSDPINNVIVFGSIFLVWMFTPSNRSSDSKVLCFFGEKNYPRYIIFIVFHLVLGLIIYSALDYFVWVPAGTEGLFAGFIVFCFDAIGVSILILSIVRSFDPKDVGPYDLGQISYFERRMFKNVGSSPICLGVPKVFVKIEKVSTKKWNVTIGMFKDKRVPFILEAPKEYVICDIAIEAHVIDTEAYLNLGGDKSDIERRLVQIVNEALNAKINELNENGKTRRFEDFNLLKSSTREIAKELEGDKSDNGICFKFAEIGFKLDDFLLKDIQNLDKSVINAEQALKAANMMEQREMMNTVSTARKTLVMYHILNGMELEFDPVIDLKTLPTGFKKPAVEVASMEEARKMVERQDGARKTIETVNSGSGRNINVVNS